MGNDVMEDKILASRLALRLLDFASWELNDLRLRIQSLEGIPELHKQDILRPEVLAQHLVEQWSLAALPRETWIAVQADIQKEMGEHLLETYHATNEFLVQQGVMAEIDLRPLVKRTPSAVTGPGAAGKTAAEPPRGKASHGGNGSGFDDSGSGMGGRWPPVRRAFAAPAPPMGAAAAAAGAPRFGAESGGSGGGRGGSGSPGSGAGRSARGAAATAGAGPQGGNGGENAGKANGAKSPEATGPVYDETRMQTATTPLARARMRAQGVMGQLKRLLTNQVAGFDDTRPNQASPQLAQAMASVERAGRKRRERTLLADAQGQIYGQAQVDQAVGALRERTSKLKEAASTSSEKATIEIVALMFQSILAEDRIPAVIRVWFARLQMPVLRVAISEPEFFESLQHPARRLIDRMGSCVLGFDVTVAGGALEVRRSSASCR
jgi:hypothetical protein